MTNEKAAHTSVPVHELIARRWSPRAFDKNQPVERAKLIALLEAARWAPSCYGEEPWTFLVWDRFRDKASWEKAFDCLAELNRKWAKNAPVLLCACANSVFNMNGKPNRWAQYDTGAASENLFLQAFALGLVAHEMGGFDVDKIRAAFSIPGQFTPMAMIAVGYQAPADILEEPKHKEMEVGSRARKPLAEKFFESAWGAPVKTD